MGVSDCVRADIDRAMAMQDCVALAVMRGELRVIGCRDSWVSGQSGIFTVAPPSPAPARVSPHPRPRPRPLLPTPIRPATGGGGSHYRAVRLWPVTVPLWGEQQNGFFP